MNISLDELKLQRGYNYTYMQVEFKHPKLQEIVDLKGGYSEYRSMVDSISLSTIDLADVLWCEIKVWYEDIESDWLFFVQQQILFNNKKLVRIKLEGDNFITEGMFLSEYATKALNYFLGLKGEYVFIVKEIDNSEEKQIILNYCEKNEDGELYTDDNCLKFTETHYNELKNFLKTINWDKDDKDLDVQQGGTRRAKELILRQKYKKRKKNKKGDINLSSIVSSIIAKGIRYEEVWQLPIYEIYEIYYRLNKIVNYENTTNAYYAGNIDTKKTSINWSEIDWSAIIKI